MRSEHGFPLWRRCSPSEGYIDLHLHTTHSDGLFTPEQLVKAALERGLRAIAVTDHDTISGVQEVSRLAEIHGIQCISGVEISAYTEEEGEIHLLGYFIDLESAQLLLSLQRQKNARSARMNQMVARLRQLGYDLTVEAVQQIAQNSHVIGRPHLAQAMVQHGIVASVDEAFQRYIAKGKPAFVHKAGLSYQEAIDTIILAGGIPIYAHPGVTKKDHLIPGLLKMGIRGLEVFHSNHSPQDVLRYQKMVEEQKLLATGGSDCHGGGQHWSALIGTVQVPYELLECLKTACNM